MLSPHNLQRAERERAACVNRTSGSLLPKEGKSGILMRERAVYEVLDEIHQPDRRTLDGVVLDVWD